ncbi:MAG TPA: hypothetical protein VJH68_03985 [Candidatus Nanoarchaeia archaeon]|nr:hypothetical protein [Candidatus Nanoarchaeia archaeon]
MVLLRIPVECHYCRTSIERRNALAVKNTENLQLFQCFSCFRQNLIKTGGVAGKADLYCERCRYKFTSSKLRCPYCNQFDAVIKAEIKMKDLI